VEFNLADLFEHAVDHFGDREYLVCDGSGARTARWRSAPTGSRTTCGARHRPGDHVGIYALNSVEWVETLWAVFKLRAVWININYRYVEDELRYLFDNADLKALVYQQAYAPRVAEVLPSMPLLRHTIVIEDGSGEDYAAIGSVSYDSAVASGSPARDFGPRSASDRYILYTGGTTGMPKGVVWRHEDVLHGARRRHRSDDERARRAARVHGREGQDGACRSRSCRSRPSCTARRSGRSWARASSATRSS
jgi:acyl-CoA synthetase (AMP-forming)/AMP-acid ligase II